MPSREIVIVSLDFSGFIFAQCQEKGGAGGGVRYSLYPVEGRGELQPRLIDELDDVFSLCLAALSLRIHSLKVFPSGFISYCLMINALRKSCTFAH